MQTGVLPRGSAAPHWESLHQQGDVSSTLARRAAPKAGEAKSGPEGSL